jgi:RNA-binding protein
MSALLLSPAQRKEYRAAAHHLDPVVLVGGDGLTPAVIKEIELALTAHGLIKVRVFSDDRDQRTAMLEQLAETLSAAAIQHIGKLLVLWRPKPEKAAAPVREDRMPGPRTIKLVTSSGRGNSRPQVKKVQVLGNQRVTAGGQIKRARPRPPLSKKKLAQQD